MQFASCVYVMEWRVYRMGCCVYRIKCYVTYFIGKRCTCITNVSILCINYLTMSPTRRHPREFSIHHVSIKQTMHYATKDRSVVKAETVVPSHHVPTTSLRYLSSARSRPRRTKICFRGKAFSRLTWVVLTKYFSVWSSLTIDLKP
jgi:hypothetical protein